MKVYIAISKTKSKIRSKLAKLFLEPFYLPLACSVDLVLGLFSMEDIWTKTNRLKPQSPYVDTLYKRDRRGLIRETGD